MVVLLHINPPALQTNDIHPVCFFFLRGTPKQLVPFGTWSPLDLERLALLEMFI